MTNIRNLSTLTKKIAPATPAVPPALSPLYLQSVQSLAAQLLRNPPAAASKPANITLFTGPDIAAKTAAAEALASNLHRELYRVNLSTTTSNSLTQLLHTTDPGSVVLLFDEGDALFGKRTDIEDSHDRYADESSGAPDGGNNLLQLLQQYPGIVILAVNSTNGCNPTLLAQTHATLKFPPTP